ncbi:uncharacterized protein si:dkey-219e21.4 isoform X3 [Pseudoliparis swirei]|uniref:uncharacterized protein si:dkey-219e21.4 isoform X3 n=1 Tax=Pseudoliparis swirei TaxID=2059687 RepID=UPI0024BD78A2|nr:uncharacterized protein si:dkey-219e21.4 isoform X3 [Pseudoliparis swirei]
MAEQESSAAEGQSARRGLAAPPAGSHGVLLDGLSFTPLDANGVPPFPRSPKLQRKIAIAAQPSQEQLVRRLEELQAEWSRTGAHIQSLKKRKADLSDEQAVQDYLDLDLRQTRSRRDQVLNKWHHHQDQVNKSIGSLQRALSSSPAEEGRKGQSDPLSPKKPDASEKDIRLNEERFQRLLKTLSSISKQLRAQISLNI